jgi:hypothetical protein
MRLLDGWRRTMREEQPMFLEFEAPPNERPRPAAAQPLPHPNGSGQCSGSYMQSGAYCIPKSERSASAIPKIGQCPARDGAAARRPASGCAVETLWAQSGFAAFQRSS